MNGLLAMVLAAAAASPETQASDVLARMRAALGGEARLAAVHSLSVEAGLRRVVPVEGAEPRDMSGDVRVDALLPDHYLKVETLSMMPGAPELSIGTGLDGEEAWLAQMNSPPGMVVVLPRSDPAAGDGLRRRIRGELWRLLIATLATVPELPLTFTLAGEAESPEGRAFLLDVSGPDGFRARLFVDTKTCRPLLLSFKGPVPRMQTVRSTGHADLVRARRDAEAMAQQARSGADEVETKLFVSEFRAVDGVLLPFALTLASEDGRREEWQVKKWRVNPALLPALFRKRS